MPWLYYTAIVSFLLIYKFINNLWRYLWIKRIKNYYYKWLKDEDKHTIHTYRQKAISLFKAANIPDEIIPWTEPTGYGQLVNSNLSVQTNFPSLYEVFAAHHATLLVDTLAVYKQRMFDTFNPLYWIDVLLHPVSKTASYITGKNETTKGKRTADLILWVIAVVAPIISSLFVPEIRSFFINLFK